MTKAINYIRNNAWLIWLFAALFYAVEFFQRVAPGVISQDIVHTFNIDEASLGAVISLYYYAYAVAQIPVGLVLDRLGCKLPLCIAAFAVSIGTLLFADSSNLWLLSIARIVVGIGSAFAFVGCLKLAKEWFTGKQFPFIVGLTNTLGVCGALFGEAPLNKMVSSYGWQSSLVFTAIGGIVVALLILGFVRNHPSSKHDMVPMPVMANIKHILKLPQSWLIGIYAGLMVAPVIAFAELWSNQFLENVHQLSSTQATFATSLIFVGIAVGGPSNGFFSSLFNTRKRVMCVGNIMALLLLLAIVFMINTSYIALCLMIFFFGFFTSSMLVSFPLNTEQHPSEISATVIAFTNMMIMIIGAIFQPTIGYILDMLSLNHHTQHFTAHQFQMALVCLPIALAINLLILYFIKESNCKNLCDPNNCDNC